MKIAVLDIETTGLTPTTNKIIEVGIVILENFKVITKYETLIHPGKPVPTAITSLTGITSKMIEKCKSFEELAEEIMAFTDSHIICGHHVNFDYSFLKKEFQLLGINFNRKVLDTARLAKFLFPGKNSYSLKSLCSHFGIINSCPHRALPDAMATAELLIKLADYAGDKLMIDIIKKEVTAKATFVIQKNVVDELPESTGVYYFMDKRNKPVYIGKAKNIKSRIQSHIRGEGNSLKIMAANSIIKNVKYELTGNELLASLLEDHEIRHHWPALNNSQKSFNKKFGVVIYKDQLDRWRMAISSSGKAHCFLIYFHQYHRAVEFILNKITTYGLNGNFCGYPGENDISVDNHNHSFEIMMDEFHNSNSLEVFLTEGRSIDETGYLLIEDGIYKGFGYMSKKETVNAQTVRSSLQSRFSSITVEQTLLKLRKNSNPDFVFSEKKKASTVI